MNTATNLGTLDTPALPPAVAMLLTALTPVGRTRVAAVAAPARAASLGETRTQQTQLAAIGITTPYNVAP